VVLAEMERFAAVRERRGEAAASEQFRLTGNYVGAKFLHDTSRDLDPQLHVHDVLANATWDGTRNDWLALSHRDADYSGGFLFTMSGPASAQFLLSLDPVLGFIDGLWMPGSAPTSKAALQFGAQAYTPKDKKSRDVVRDAKAVRRDAIEHPATALRQAEIEAIRASLGNADRHAVQQALMPFRHLLPPHLRGPNARIGEQA
ncbi:MAG: hypothetical protein RLZZ300_956, partial [Pseudomonadota bacterium]